MAGIIWFAVVIFVVVRCLNNEKKKKRKTQLNVNGKQARNNRVNTARPAGVWTNQQTQRTYTTQTQRSRTQQKSTAANTGTRPQPARQKQKTENSILQKAMANTSQQFTTDTLEERGVADLDRVPAVDEIMKDHAKASHIHSEHEADHSAELRNQHGVDDFDTYHLMDEVNDLIVKGYSGNLEFEHDFLSEATDMLNRMYV